MSFIAAWNYFYCRTSLNELRWMHREEFPAGLSYHDMLYMNIIAITPDCTVSGLAEMLGVSTPGVTEKVNGLVRKGLVEKVRDSVDRRVFRLCLKPEIAAVYESWGRFSGEMETQLLQKYSKNDLALFTRILKDAADYDRTSEAK
ncbi:MAG: MarR family winged helix-turn-helix transcriptional regulator [Treponema sp.]|jgi:DNA-binding MarR family transcriptional regulator|nr:MarR family winged helix-turn-helix transcriptional regulator [Treponema sp.]